MGDTTWEHLGLEVAGEVAEGDDATATVRLRNTGPMAHWDVGAGRMTVDPGTFALAARRSSRERTVGAEIVASAP